MAITLQTVSSGYNLSVINANFQSLQSALNDAVLWRKGNVAGETLMERDLDMNGHALLNIGVNLQNPGSLITVGAADLRYYNITGDVLEGTLDAGQHQLKNLAKATSSFDAIRKQELDEEELARQNADANLQSQMTGEVPLEASAFSEISWHSQEIGNSVNIPANKNAWSFGPQMEIEQGQAVSIGVGSTWTIANGRVVENEDLHNLIADSITTPDGLTTLDIQQASTSIASLTSRITAEESKVQPIALGGTGATTATEARTNLAAAASGTNSDITTLDNVTGGIKGAANGSSAASGYVGEYLSAFTATPLALTNNTAIDVVTLSLTPGDWDVWGSAQFIAGTGTVASLLSGGIGVTGGTVPSAPDRVVIRVPNTTASLVSEYVVPQVRINVSTTTNVYLTISCAFTGGTATGTGGLRARRAR